MRVLIFGGTTEGRCLAEQLSMQPIEVVVSVATYVGQDALNKIPNLSVITGRKSKEEIAALMSHFDCCVDATHPYAAEVSEHIHWASKKTGVPVRRFLRHSSAVPFGVWVDSAAQAASFLLNKEGKILLTCGTKELEDFSILPPERLFPRVLPVSESLSACQKWKIPTQNIIAMYGPFSQKLNEAILEQYQIRFLVTKESGRAGGFEEKAAAAQMAGAGLIVIARPPQSGDCVEDIQGIMQWLTAQGQH